MKRMGATLGKSLALSQDELRLAGTIAASIVEEALEKPASMGRAQEDFIPAQDYLEVAQDEILVQDSRHKLLLQRE